jgi:transcriptional regulator with XRE-family HTH domain
MESKVKQDEKIDIGKNIRKIRLERKIGQTELVGMLQLQGVKITREMLVKIERGVHHVSASQLKAIRDVPERTIGRLLRKRSNRFLFPVLECLNMMSDHFLDGTIIELQAFVQSYGWTVLFSLFSFSNILIELSPFYRT